MASINSRYNDAGRQFIDLHHRPNHPTIIAVLLGGSRIYSTGYLRDGNPKSDWDGAIIVPTKLGILQLVNEQRQNLMEMLGIVREECPNIRVPDVSSPHWDHFDAVRIADFDRLEEKRSVKILSLDYFSTSKTFLRVLSFKDKRVFETIGPPMTRTYRLQQATRLVDGFFILHDQWVYTAPLSGCVHGRDVNSAMFGVTADLLLSGFWLHGRDPDGSLIQSYILAKYTALSGLHANTHTFAKHHRFSSEHHSWLAEKLLDLYRRLDLPPERTRCYCSLKEPRFLCSEAFHALGSPCSSVAAQSTPPSSSSVEVSKQTEILSVLQRAPSAFSSNSTNAEITISAGTVDGRLTKIFSKRSQNPQQELEGALKAAAFGIRVQVPRVALSGELWYPLFEGITESELRLRSYHNGWTDCYSVETLLYAELVKAEDMLRLYSKCFSDPNMPGVETEAQPIHRFFYSRVVENVRFHQFYGESIPVGLENWSMADFLNTPWKVNGVTYPSLRELFRVAVNVVHPRSSQSMSCPVVFGLGDAHGANVMISNDASRNNSRDILYVDYEVTGFHPVMLDLAKSLYIDVFFATVYMDLLPQVTKTKYTIEGNLITVDFTPEVDDVTQAIFDVKRRHLLQPLFDLALSHGKDLEKNIPLLSNALLLCATLTRNYSEHPHAFFQNMATGIVLAGAVDYDGFYAGLKSLGLGH
ncbi:MAG: hypothetical protein Q9169_003176 [Polycauliona sp. 2 TL-2023]